MSEPTTEAALEYARRRFPEGPSDNREYTAMRERELAELAKIEAEARATAEAQRDRALIELDRLIGVIQSGIAAAILAALRREPERKNDG